MSEENIITKPTFKSELTTLINKHSLENITNTPDYILADYLLNCLEAFYDAIHARNQWHSADSNNNVELRNTKKE